MRRTLDRVCEGATAAALGETFCLNNHYTGFYTREEVASRLATDAVSHTGYLLSFSRCTNNTTYCRVVDSKHWCCRYLTFLVSLVKGFWLHCLRSAADCEIVPLFPDWADNVWLWPVISLTRTLRHRVTLTANDSIMCLNAASRGVCYQLDTQTNQSTNATILK